MSDIQEIINVLIKFRDERDWKQFHNTKNLALGLFIEAAELNELFLWKNEEEAERVNRTRLAEELADVLSYAFLLAEKHNLDIKSIMLDKIRKNAKKYPVEKAKGSAKKYDEL
jgi:NTP pyrophosphatase (non-canonical NTP hydrolase)